MNAEDRELLDLAAKAAGYTIRWFEDSVTYGDTFGIEVEPGNPLGFSPWNPLTDDGDALRLAIALDIHIKRYAGATTAQVLGSSDHHTEHDHWDVNSSDRMASTRRAITWAAAKIGRAMP